MTAQSRVTNTIQRVSRIHTSTTSANPRMPDSLSVDAVMAAALQHQISQTLLRLRRSLLTGSCVAAFVALWWAGSTSGALAVDRTTVGLGVVVVGVGLALLTLSIIADFRLRAIRASLGTPVALWASLGCIATATFDDGPLRLALLAVTLLGLTFAALYLTRARLRLIALSTWAAASLGLVAHVKSGANADIPNEFLVWSCYSLLLVVALFVADQVARLREALTGRTEELERALTRVRDLAMRDDLTGLYNRRQLMEYLYRQKASADRGTLSFALCYVDLDHFKRVNDLFGHKQGDEVLRAFAEIARKVVREEDFVARIGGEEFVLVLTNATLTDAVQVSNRLRRQTQLMVIDPKAPDFAVTASVGVAAYRAREAVEQLMSRADSAMYAAKTQGRNRVVVAPETETRAITPAAGR
jgi:diguanylate cyclase (GGDEF)-like protein